MTLVDAAIEILRTAGKPIHFKELTRLALEEGLVAETIKAPEQAMQTALAAEARTGGRLVRVKPGIFALPGAPSPVELAAIDVTASMDPVDADEPDDVDADAGGLPAADATGAVGDGAAAGKRRRRGRRGGRGKRAAGAGAAAGTGVPMALGAADEAFPEPGTPEEAVLAEQMAAEAEAEDDGFEVEATKISPRTMAQATDEWENTPTLRRPGVDVDLVSPHAPTSRRMAPLPDDDALLAEYADEADAMTAPPVEGELVDAQTADEDRPMLTPIESDRSRGRGRRGERGRGRKERGRGPEAAGARPAQPQGGGGGGGGGGRPNGQNQQAQGRGDRDPGRDRGRGGRDRNRGDRDPDRESPARQAEREARNRGGSERGPDRGLERGFDRGPDRGPMLAFERVVERAGSVPVTGGTPLAEAGLACLEALGDPRPVHTRQLAAMAVKRRLTTGDPEKLSEHMTIALLDDARDRVRRGLRPRARQQGSGLFSLTAARLEPELRLAEDAAGRWLESLEAATVDALRRRLERLKPSALEKLARVYLERSGYVNVAFERKVDETIYLSAELPRAGGARRALVGVVGGGGELGRRAVGELRAGVEAKAFAEGILLAAATLGPDAERELAERPTPPVDVLSSSFLARAFAARGVGVVAATAPIAYLDVDLLGELEGKP